MALYDIDSVKSREDLINFIYHLRMDLKTNSEEWENITLENYLEAMERWITDMDGVYLNLNKPMPKQPSWKTIAQILYASSAYE